MSNYLETKICQNLDNDFQLMVSELCQCVNFEPQDFRDYRFSFLLMEIARRNKKLTMDQLATSSVLDQKVGKLQLNSVIRDVCVELTLLHRSHIDKFSGKSVFSLIKSCHKGVMPKKIKVKILASYCK